jgi:tetratricopeptide (TPR) repeat protein
VFFVCLILWLVSELVARPDRLPRWLALGAALGGLSLARENALLLALMVLVWAALKDRTGATKSAPRMRLRRPAAFIAGLTIVLLPVAARNAAVGGGLFLTTAQFGPNFYIGNNPRADGTYAALREGRGDPSYERQDATELAEQALGRRLSPSEVSAFWRDRALQYIRTEPGEWLKLVGRKFMLMINATEMIDTEAQESHAEWSAPLRWGSPIGHFGVLLPLALLGIIATWHDRKRLWIVYALSAAYALSVVAFFVVARYRYPLVPFAVLFAAAGVSELPALVREGSRAQRFGVAAAVIVVAALAQVPVLSGDAMRAITQTNLGVALQDQARFSEAAAHYRRAIEIEPDYAPAYNSLGVALRAQGRLEEAIASYRQALARSPDYPDAHHNLATALLEQRKPDEAIAHFEIARRSLPMTVGAHNNFGVALASAGRREEAIAQFQAALALQPDAPVTLRNLGEACARLQRYPEAIGYFRRIVELDAGSAQAHYDLGNVLMEAGRLPEAAAELRAAVRLAPSPQAHSGLGVALAAQGSIDDAIAEFQRALQLQPDFAPAQRYLAMARESRR